MQQDSPAEDQSRKFVPGPPQLPPLATGQKIKSGPYTTTVTDQMVAQRERENQELYRAWLNEQQRRNMLPDQESEEYVGDFKHDSVRRSFIRKVFCILTIQLLFTAAVIAVFLFVDAAKKFMILHWYIWLIALISFIVSYCVVSCSEYGRRRPPCNYICLCILLDTLTLQEDKFSTLLQTVAMSYLTAFASAFYSIEVIFMAIGMTSLVTLIIGVLATFSKFDLTMRSGLMTIIGLVAIVAIVVMTIVMMFTYIRVLHLIIAIIGTLLLSMYLYFDIQTIMGGRKVEISPDEVVFATIQLYVDIILLYQYILMFMGFLHDG